MFNLLFSVDMFRTVLIYLKYVDCFLFSNGVKDANPFDDEAEEWDDGGAYALVDNGEPGVPVRALYDYEAAEQDELTLNQVNFKTVPDLSKM